MAKKTGNLLSPRPVVCFPDTVSDKKAKHLKTCVHVYLSAYICILDLKNLVQKVLNQIHPCCTLCIWQRFLKELIRPN